MTIKINTTQCVHLDCDLADWSKRLFVTKNSTLLHFQNKLFLKTGLVFCVGHSTTPRTFLISKVGTLFHLGSEGSWPTLEAKGWQWNEKALMGNFGIKRQEKCDLCPDSYILHPISHILYPMFCVLDKHTHYLNCTRVELVGFPAMDS